MLENLFALSARSGLEVMSTYFRIYCLWSPGLIDTSTSLSLRRSRLFFYLCEGAPKFSEG